MKLQKIVSPPSASLMSASSNDRGSLRASKHLLSETKFMKAKRKCEGHTVLGHIQRIDKLFTTVRDDLESRFLKLEAMNKELRKQIQVVGFEQVTTKRQLSYLRSRNN
jgi:riboflavin synthase alpha subunit